MKHHAPDDGDQPGKPTRPDTSAATGSSKWRGAEEKVSGLLAAILPCFRHNPTYEASLSDSLKLVSNDAKRACNTLERACHRADDRDTIVAAAKVAFPVFRNWLGAELGAGIPDAPAVKRLVAAVDAALAPVLPSRFVAQVAAFIRAALADRAVTDILENVSHVSKLTSANFEEVLRSFNKAENRDDIIAGVKYAFPVVRDWLNTHIKDDAIPTTEDIGRLLGAIFDRMRSVLGAGLVNTLKVFVKVALADEATVAVLRNVRDMGPFPWDEKVSIDWTAARNCFATEGIFSVIKPYFALHPSGRSGLLVRLKFISWRTKLSFMWLEVSLNATDNRDYIVASAAAAFPIVRSWTKSNLANSSMPSAASVDELISEVRTCLEPTVGFQITKLGGNFLRTALCDAVVVNVLRETREMGPFPWDGD